jgi:hypothetical protein
MGDGGVTGAAGLETSGIIGCRDLLSSTSFSSTTAGAEEIDSDGSNSIFFLLLPGLGQFHWI